MYPLQATVLAHHAAFARLVTRAKTLAATLRTLICALALIFSPLLGSVGLPGPADAALITNASFETTTLASPGGYICQTGSTCVSNVTGWSSTCNTGGCGNGSTVATLCYSGTNCSAFNGGIGLYGAIGNSPDGGNFIAIDGDSTYTATLSQTITGLTIGTSYNLQFYQAAGQQRGTTGATTERWQVTFGTQTLNSALMNNASQGTVGWNLVSLTFLATTTSQALTFLAVGTPGGQPPVVLLDGLTLAVPEPSSLALLAMAALSLVAVRRRRKAKA